MQLQITSDINSLYCNIYYNPRILWLRGHIKCIASLVGKECDNIIGESFEDAWEMKNKIRDKYQIDKLIRELSSLEMQQKESLKEMSSLLHFTPTIKKYRLYSSSFNFYLNMRDQAEDMARYFLEPYANKLRRLFFDVEIVKEPAKYVLHANCYKWMFYAVANTITPEEKSHAYANRGIRSYNAYVFPPLNLVPGA